MTGLRYSLRRWWATIYLVDPGGHFLRAGAAMMGSGCLRVFPALVVTLVGVAGCGACGTDDEEPVRVVAEAEVRAEIAALAGAMAAVLGTEPTRPASNTSECENDVGDDSGEVQYVQGTYQFKVADSEDRENFTKVRDRWRDQGWVIVEDWYKQETGAGSVSAKAADDSLGFTLTGTASPTLLAVLIHSGCFREPAGASSPR